MAVDPTNLLRDTRPITLRPETNTQIVDPTSLFQSTRPITLNLEDPTSLFQNTRPITLKSEDPANLFQNTRPVALRSEANTQLVDPNINGLISPIYLSPGNSTANSFGAHFLEVLSHWAGAIPLQSFWVVVVTVPPGVRQWIEKFKDSSWDGIGWDGYDLSVYDHLLEPLFSEKNTQQGYVHGCFFARSINIPGEKMDMVSTSTSNGGLLFPSVGKSRTPQNNISMSFMETNASYVDTVIRPWSIITSYLGLVPRIDSIKGNVQAFFYTKNYTAKTSTKRSNAAYEASSVSPKKRKIFTFHDVVPTSISNEECAQRGGDALIERSVNFYFSNYTVENKDIVSLLQ